MLESTSGLLFSKCNLSAETITANSGAKLSVGDSYATISDTASLVVNGGTLDLYETTLTGTAVTMDSGTINVLGNVETGALTLNSGTLAFGSTEYGIDLAGNALALGEYVVITLTVDSLSNLGDTYTLFTNVAETSTGLEDRTVVFTDGTNTKSYTATFSGNEVKVEIIPEPATASLSLLALAALAARRRRR